MNVPGKILICTFQRSETEELRGYAWRYRGRRFFDLRKWVQIEGKWTPTRQGCTVRESELERLPMAVELARALPVKVTADS